LKIGPNLKNIIKLIPNFIKETISFEKYTHQISYFMPIDSRNEDLAIG